MSLTDRAETKSDHTETVQNAEPGISADAEEEEFESRFMNPRRTSWLIPTVVLLFIVCITFVAIYFIKKSTELGKSADEIVSEIAENRAELYKIACSYADGKITAYEEKQQVYGFLNSKIFSAKITVREDGTEGYSVLLDGEKAFTVYSTDPQRNKFRTECCMGAEYSAELPRGAAATLNGIALSNPESTAYFSLSEYENALSDIYGADRYELGTIFSDVIWSASLDGQDLNPPVLKNGTWYFSYPSVMTKDVTVTAPEGSEIIVNGMLVTDVSGRTLIPYPFLSRFEENTDGTPMSFVQNLGSFFRDPVIEVVYNGARLEKSGDGSAYMLPDSMFLDEYTIIAPSDCTVRVNGVSLEAGEVSVTEIPCALLEGGTITEDYSVKKIPSYTEYSVGGLFREPVITCTDQTGNGIPRDDYQSGGQKTVFPFFSYDEIPEADKITPLSFTKSYAKYIYNASSALAVNFRNLSGYIPGGAPAYEKLHEMYLPLYNSGTVYKSLAFGEPVYSGYRVFADNLYGVTVELPFTAKKDGATLDFTVKLEVLYTFQGKIRRILNYNELEEET